MKYYSILNIVNNKKHQDIFNDFINDIYGHQLLDDYTHLLNEHGQELQEIHESIINNKILSKCEEWWSLKIIMLIIKLLIHIDWSQDSIHWTDEWQIDDSNE